jgi:hypothetical protein
MIYDEDTFTARTPDGERVTLRVKRDGEPGGLIRKFKRIFAGEADDDADRDHDASNDPVRAPAGDHHHASKVADLLVEAGIAPDRATALRHLLRSHDGAALLHRLARTHKSTAKESPMHDSLQKIARDLGAIAVCKTIAGEQRAFGISEHSLVELVSNHDRQPGETAAKCFTRHYEANPEVRKAVQVAKLSPFDPEPVYVGGPDATHEAINSTEQSEAYAQLETMAAKLRASSPWLSADQAFARAFEDPKNAALASKAHKRPAATTSYPFPR